MFSFLKSIFAGGTATDLTELIKGNAFLVDVRTQGEFASGHLKGSVNIPLDSIGGNLQKFKGKKDIIVFCRSGNRSSQAKAILDANGITGVVNGGSIDYVSNFVK